MFYEFGAAGVGVDVGVAPADAAVVAEVLRVTNVSMSV